MPVKKYKPTSPGRRFMSVSAFDDLTPGKKAEKSLQVSLKKNAGRNAQGKLTVRHQGGGHRKLYRLIDFKRSKRGIPATVTAQRRFQWMMISSPGMVFGILPSLSSLMSLEARCDRALT